MSNYIDKDSIASKVMTMRDWFAGQALSGFWPVAMTLQTQIVPGKRNLCNRLTKWLT